MRTQKWFRIVITLAVITGLIITYDAPRRVAAAEELKPGQKINADKPLLSLPAVSNTGVASRPSTVEAEQIEDTTLSVSILSSPWVMLDSNDPEGLNGPVPKVYLVEGRVTNVGVSPATNVVFILDYNEDPANNWVLLSGEDPERMIDSLDPGEEYHAYWFATYELVPNSLHRYTISAYADNAATSFNIR